MNKDRVEGKVKDVAGRVERQAASGPTTQRCRPKGPQNKLRVGPERGGPGKDAAKDAFKKSDKNADTEAEREAAERDRRKTA